MGIDFFPTFIDAAGIAAPKGKILDGLSLLPLLTQSVRLKSAACFGIFLFICRPIRERQMIRTDPLFHARLTLRYVRENGSFMNTSKKGAWSFTI